MENNQRTTENVLKTIFIVYTTYVKNMRGKG